MVLNFIKAKAATMNIPKNMKTDRKTQELFSFILNNPVVSSVLINFE
jgi:hypothetical protein